MAPMRVEEPWRTSVVGRDHSCVVASCQAVAAFVLAVCDGLSLQWLLDPEAMPSSAQLLDGLAMVFAASFGADAGSVSGSSRR